MHAAILPAAIRFFLGIETLSVKVSSIRLQAIGYWDSGGTPFSRLGFK